MPQVKLHGVGSQWSHGLSEGGQSIQNGRVPISSSYKIGNREIPKAGNQQLLLE